jgi:protein-tyrosine phosphatase
MNFINKGMYNLLCKFRNTKTLTLVNSVTKIDDYNLIIPNLYLGNVKCAHNLNFLLDHNIQGIVNCTEHESFHEYFNDEHKRKMRLSINDSRSDENIIKFKSEILETINFIDNCLDENKPVFVHCYWGLMRSATVVAGYLIKKYNLKADDAIFIVKTNRPYSLISFYNFNEILQFVEDTYKK